MNEWMQRFELNDNDVDDWINWFDWFDVKTQFTPTYERVPVLKIISLIFFIINF